MSHALKPKVPVYSPNTRLYINTEAGIAIVHMIQLCRETCASELQRDLVYL